MKDDNEVRFVHTPPCSVCRGRHPEYRSRMWCRGCPSLRDQMMERGLLPKPVLPKPTTKTPIDLTEKIFALKANGLSLSKISDATGLAVGSVRSRIYEARKAAGTVKHRKRSEEV